MREEVRHPHARRLVGHTEGVAEVLDREVAVLLRLLQERHRRRLGHEAARRVVVDLEALLEEVGVVGRATVPEEAVCHGLQRHRSQAVTARDGCRWQVDAPVLEIGHRAGGVRQVVHVEQLEAQLLGHDADGAVGERAADVAGRLQLLLGQALDVGEVVAALAHPQPQLGVGPARLLGRGDRLALTTLQLAVQPEDRLERLVAGALRDPDRCDPEPAEHGARLRAVELDLERGAVVRRLGGQQLGDLGPGDPRDLLQERELGLALAVLDEAQVAPGDADGGTELVERHPVLDAVMADAVAEGRELDSGGHSLSITKESQLFTPRISESGTLVRRK